MEIITKTNKVNIAAIASLSSIAINKVFIMMPVQENKSHLQHTKIVINLKNLLIMIIFKNLHFHKEVNNFIAQRSRLWLVKIKWYIRNSMIRVFRKLLGGVIRTNKFWIMLWLVIVCRFLKTKNRTEKKILEKIIIIFLKIIMSFTHFFNRQQKI